jgi:hypothetical protein
MEAGVPVVPSDGTSRLVALADAYVALLEAGSWSLPITVERTYLAFLDLSEVTASTRVLVNPGDHVSGIAARAKTRDTYRIDVGIIRKVATTDEFDEALALAEEIQAYLERARLDSAPRISVERETLFDDEWLARTGLFATAVSVTFEEVT